MPLVSFTIAMTMPARTKTQMAACVQIQKGDMSEASIARV